MVASSTDAAARLAEALLPWNLLIVEDDEDDVQRLRAALAESGARTELTRVSTLRDALAHARSGTCELLLLDLGLPDSTGLDTLRAAQRAVPHLPVVVMTSLDDETIARQAVQEGAQDYVIKSEWGRKGGSRALQRSLRYAIGRQRTLTALRETARVRTMFMASASHELRTPITIIRDYAWLLSDGTAGTLEPAQVECVEAILRNCTRLGALVSDLLDTSKMESGNLVLKMEFTHPSVLLQQCHDDFKSICQVKHQRLDLQLSEGLQPILCDRQRLTQVIVNLLTNAHRFTDDGGTIVLQATQANGEVQIHVRDSGVGIPLEDQRRIFAAFVQLDRRAGPGPQGTGLGLHIAKRIVDLHGGTIAVLSRPGDGSTFTVTMPVVAQGADLAGLRACLLACASPGTAADLTPRAHTVVWLRSSPRAGSETRSTWLREVEATANSLFRRHDSAFYSEREQMLACVIEGAEHEAHGYVRRLGSELGADAKRLLFAVVPVSAGSPHESATPPPLGAMRALTGMSAKPIDDKDEAPRAAAVEVRR